MYEVYYVAFVDIGIWFWRKILLKLLKYEPGANTTMVGNVVRMKIYLVSISILREIIPYFIQGIVCSVSFTYRFSEFRLPDSFSVESVGI